jgi:hypothetical protein
MKLRRFCVSFAPLAASYPGPFGPVSGSPYALVITKPRDTSIAERELDSIQTCLRALEREPLSQFLPAAASPKSHQEAFVCSTSSLL